MFYMPGVRWRRFIYAFVLLGAPGVIFLIGYEGGIPNPEEFIAVVTLAVLVAGFSAQYFANRVFLTPEELIIRKDGEEFTVRLYDIEDAFLARTLDEVDAIELPEGHYPMEYESHDSNIVVLVMRNNTASRSTAHVRNGITTKAVSFNVSRPERFLSFLRMRV